jgi:hypothetical protein
VVIVITLREKQKKEMEKKGKFKRRAIMQHERKGFDWLN